MAASTSTRQDTAKTASGLPGIVSGDAKVDLIRRRFQSVHLERKRRISPSLVVLNHLCPPSFSLQMPSSRAEKEPRNEITSDESERARERVPDSQRITKMNSPNPSPPPPPPPPPPRKVRFRNGDGRSDGRMMGNGSDCQMSNDDDDAAAAAAVSAVSAPPFSLLPAIVSEKERCALMAGRGSRGFRSPSKRCC